MLLIPRLLAGFLGEPSSRLTTALAVISAALFVFAAFRFGPSFVRAGYSQDAKDDKRSLDTFGVFSRVVGPVVIIGVISTAIPDIFAMSRYPLSYVWGGSAAAGVLLSLMGLATISIGQGRKAAESIDATLRGRKLEASAPRTPIRSDKIKLDWYEKAERHFLLLSMLCAA